MSTARFTGTKNPRHLRVIQALITHPLPRQQLDQVASTRNGPDQVAKFRRHKRELLCTRTKKIDLGRFNMLPGVYHFTKKTRLLINAWHCRRAGGPTYA